MTGNPSGSRGVAALLIGALCGAAAAGPDEQQRIADLERRLELLSLRLAQLERGGGHAGAGIASGAAAQRVRPDVMAVAAAAAADTRPAVAPAQPQAGMAPAMDRGVAGIPLHAFVDVGFASDRPDPTGRRAGFGIGTVDLYMTPSFGDRVKSIVELVFEQDAHGELAVDLERVQLGYTFSDALTVWAGRYHTPIGHWNAAFHHGAQIQTSVLRPRFLGFEDQGGILPVHGVGLLGSGVVPMAGGRTKYDLFVANGTPVVDGTLKPSGFKDDDGNKLFGVNLRHEFGGAMDGLTLGLHGFSAHAATYDASGALEGRSRLRVAGAFAVLDRDDWELIAEYYTFRNRDQESGSGHSSWAGFAQAGYRFGERWTPYARGEKAVLDQGDRYFREMHSGRSYQRATAGLRYELDDRTALKLEFGRTDELQTDGSMLRSNGVRGQVAARF